MKTNFEILYEHVGYLFYALAAEFRGLTSYEDSRLNELLDEHWKVLNPKEAPLHLQLNAHLHSGVHRACAVALDPDEAFCIFEDFFLVHKMSFGEPLKEKIVKCANAIVHDFYRLDQNSKIISEVKRLLETSHYNLMTNGNGTGLLTKSVGLSGLPVQ